MRHDLKCDAEPFSATWQLRKLYEIRKDDRRFEVGDTVVLRERAANEYTGRRILAHVSWKTCGGSYGLPLGLCVLGLHNVTRIDGSVLGRRPTTLPEGAR